MAASWVRQHSTRQIIVRLDIRSHATDRHCTGTLNIIVKDWMLISIRVEQVLSIGNAKVFKVKLSKGRTLAQEND